MKLPPIVAGQTQEGQLLETLPKAFSQIPSAGKKKIETEDYRQFLGDKGARMETQAVGEKIQSFQAYTKKLSLAQKRGLVKKPDAPLTIEQWNTVLEKAKSRAKAESSCPICMEDFRLKPQVVLSCSHFFHRDCLASFEKFHGGRKCPICRAE